MTAGFKVYRFFSDNKFPVAVFQFQGICSVRRLFFYYCEDTRLFFLRQLIISLTKTPQKCYKLRGFAEVARKLCAQSVIKFSVLVDNLAGV